MIERSSRLNVLYSSIPYLLFRISSSSGGVSMGPTHFPRALASSSSSYSSEMSGYILGFCNAGCKYWCFANSFWRLRLLVSLDGMYALSISTHLCVGRKSDTALRLGTTNNIYKRVKQMSGAMAGMAYTAFFKASSPVIVSSPINMLVKITHTNPFQSRPPESGFGLWLWMK